MHPLSPIREAITKQGYEIHMEETVSIWLYEAKVASDMWEKLGVQKKRRKIGPRGTVNWLKSVN